MGPWLFPVASLPLNSCLFLAFSSLFFFNASSLYCFFSACSISFHSFSKNIALFAFSFSSSTAKLSSFVGSLAHETDVFGAVYNCSYWLLDTQGNLTRMML